jgi:hypothetical protein
MTVNLLVVVPSDRGWRRSDVDEQTETTQHLRNNEHYPPGHGQPMIFPGWEMEPIRQPILRTVLSGAAAFESTAERALCKGKDVSLRGE